MLKGQQGIDELKLYLAKLEASLNKKYYGEKPDERHPEGSGEHGGRFAPREGGPSSSAAKPAKPSKEGQHAGAGYSKNAKYDKHGVIHTDSVEDAQLALHENKKVNLDQPEKVTLVLDRIHATAQDMERKGEKAPAVDLCNMTVKGTNLFCQQTKEVPRAHMPQFAKDGKPGDVEGFQSYLADQGINSHPGRIPASHMKATQNQLDGVKVASMMQGMRKDPNAKWVKSPLVVSKEGYVVDGHHRAFAMIGLDPRKGQGMNVNVVRVNAPIIEILGHALKYTKGQGRAAFGKALTMHDLVRKLDHFLADSLSSSLKKKL